MDKKNIRKLEKTWNNIMATEKFTPFENEGMMLIKKGINLIKESQ